MPYAAAALAAAPNRAQPEEKNIKVPRIMKVSIFLTIGVPFGICYL